MLGSASMFTEYGLPFLPSQWITASARSIPSIVSILLSPHVWSNMPRFHAEGVLDVGHWIRTAKTLATDKVA